MDQHAAAAEALETSILDLAHRYTPLAAIGQGHGTIVFSAFDLTQQHSVAVKRIDALEDNATTQRTLRELIILSRMSHENVIDLRDAIVVNLNQAANMRVYLVHSLMETDLARVLQYRSRIGKALSNQQVQSLTAQSLCGLKYIHSANVLHRDLKPANLLVNLTTCRLRICDFDLARVSDPVYRHAIAGGGCELTEYVVTKPYRAPEVMANSRDYDRPVDIWSLGCILAEMLGNRRLFNVTASDCYRTLFARIFDVIGTPSKEEIESMRNEDARRFFSDLPRKEARALNTLFPSADREALDLLARMLKFSARTRIAVGPALQHRYLRGFGERSESVLCREPFKHDDEKIDRCKTEELRARICSFVRQFSRDARRRRAHQQASAAVDELYKGRTLESSV